MDATLQFFSSGSGVLGSDGGEPGEAVRVFADRVHHEVVALARKCDRGGRVEDLNPGRCQGEDLSRDAGPVHVLEAEVAEIGHARDHFGDARTGIAEVEAAKALKAWIVVRAVAEESPVAVQNLRRSEGFFRGNTAIGNPTGDKIAGATFAHWNSSCCLTALMPGTFFKSSMVFKGPVDSRY